MVSEKELDLSEADILEALQNHLHSPIGLSLGGETPEEIALAIVAEIQAVKNRRQPQHLRNTTAAIHADSPKFSHQAMTDVA